MDVTLRDLAIAQVARQIVDEDPLMQLESTQYDCSDLRDAIADELRGRKIDFVERFSESAAGADLVGFFDFIVAIVHDIRSGTLETKYRERYPNGIVDECHSEPPDDEDRDWRSFYWYNWNYHEHDDDLIAWKDIRVNMKVPKDISKIVFVKSTAYQDDYEDEMGGCMDGLSFRDEDFEMAIGDPRSLALSQVLMFFDKTVFPHLQLSKLG